MTVAIVGLTNEGGVIVFFCVQSIDKETFDNHEEAYHSGGGHLVGLRTRAPDPAASHPRHHSFVAASDEHRNQPQPDPASHIPMARQWGSAHATHPDHVLLPQGRGRREVDSWRMESHDDRSCPD